jgi:hypothetical protein
MDNNVIIERKNRYGDVIRFTQQDKKVTMTGMLDMAMRYGWANDYDLAYLKYMEDDKNTTKDLTFELFERKMESDNDFFWQYSKWVTSKEGVICFVDPSGGPYIALGSNLAYYFQCEDNMIVNDIKMYEKEVEFTID